MASQVVLFSGQAPFAASNATESDDSASLPAVLAALVPSLVTAVIFLGLFALLRKPWRRIYSPRTYLDVIPEKHRTPSASNAPFAWIRTLENLRDKFLLEHSSLDAYLYLRFLRTITFICLVGCCITWPILFPVNATGGGNASQLDKLGFGNVQDPKRLYAHAVVAWLFFAFVMFVIARERIWLVGLRQAWSLSNANAPRLSSRTVLYLDPPDHVSASADAKSNFGDEAIRQWFVTATSKLDHLVRARNSKTVKLESHQVSFLRRADKTRRKLAKANGTSGEGPTDHAVDELRPSRREYYVAGPREDVLENLRDAVNTAARQVDESREAYSAESSTLRHHAVFVEYADQSAAQRAYRGRSKLHVPLPPTLDLQSRQIGTLPKEILWDNLQTPQAARLAQNTLANIFVALLIIFWSIPTAFIGTVSNANYLADNIQWLEWIKNLPSPVLGLLTGLVPPLLTSMLASYVPNILRYLARKCGEPTTVTAELQVQAWYYAFQLIQVFFVTAMASSATAFIPKIINQPHQVPLLLAENLPKSSNFYLTYFVLQGLGSSAKNVLNFSDLLQYIFFDAFINATPRQKYDQYISLKGIGWGKVFPKYTNFAIIALAYSCVSPLVLGFATIGLTLIYFSFRHNILFVILPSIETMGKCYKRALEQLLTGVYIGELYLIGLFGLRKAIGPSIMTAILFLGTIAYNIVMNQALRPLEDHLPDELLTAEGDEEPLLTAEQGEAVEDANESSRVQRVGHEMRIPQRVLDPVAQFFEPHIYASHKAMTAFLNAGDADPPTYGDEELRMAYQNPSLTSKTPIVWLPADELGLSKKETEANSGAGIETTDEGAWLDQHSRVVFDKDNLRALPLWKDPVQY